ncbi:hypothetical protein ACQ4PT_009088 [Festuca glaucescens]
MEGTQSGVKGIITSTYMVQLGGPKSSEEVRLDARPKSQDDDDGRPIGYNGRLYVDENAIKSDEAMRAFYEHWCKHHSISRERHEMERRFKKFSERARAVHSAGGTSGPMSLNIFADMTKEEAALLIGKPRRKGWRALLDQADMTRGGDRRRGARRTNVKNDARPIGYKRHLYVDENALKSDEAMWAFYEHWCKHHGISRERHEMERRFKKFSERARAVHRAGGASDPMPLNIFADMTKEEVGLRIGKPRRKRISPVHWSHS